MQISFLELRLKPGLAFIALCPPKVFGLMNRQTFDTSMCQSLALSPPATTAQRILQIHCEKDLNFENFIEIKLM